MVQPVQRSTLWPLQDANQTPSFGGHRLEVSDGILDLGVAAMVGLQFEHLPVPVGDEAVIAVGGEEGQLGTGRGLHTPDDEPHRCGVRFTLEGSAGGLGHIGGAVHPVGNGSPGIL